MKFNFSLNRRQPAEARYTFVKAGMPDLQWELYTTLLSGALAASSHEQEMAAAAVRELVRQNDPAFVATLSLHLLDRGHFKKLSFWLSAELSVLPGQDEQAAALLARILRQPADLAEWVGYYFRAATKGQKPGRAVRRVLTTLLQKLDEYAYLRFDREVRSGLQIAFSLLRPKALHRDQKSLFDRILRDQLPARASWEQEWHALHQQKYESPEQRQVVLRDKWKQGISTFRIGYTALLENLQPMLHTVVSGKVLKLAAQYLGNAAAVTQGGYSPLRMLEAYRSLKRLDMGGTVMLSEALEQAALYSSWSLSDFGKNAVSVIAMDVSDSMKTPITGAGGALRFDIAPLLALLWKQRGDKVITGIIGNTWKPMELTNRPVLSATNELGLREGEAGYAINAHLILQDLLRKGQAVDNVLVFTDSRLWDKRTFYQDAGANLGEWWRTYKRQVAAEAKLFLFDLAGYGAPPLQILEDDVYLVAGWQEQLPDILHAVSHPLEQLV